MRLDLRSTVLVIVALATTGAAAVLAVSGQAQNGFAVTPASPIETPTPPIAVPSPPVARNVYLAPFGDFPRANVEALVEHYRERYGLTVEIAPSIPLPDGALNRKRNQLIAEGLVEAIAATDLAASDPEAVIIGLTDEDVYIESMDWRFAYGLRSGETLAVVSTARMDALRADEARQMDRLRKMVTRDVGILYYGLALSDDRSSVLYKDILGPDDLDRMTEDF
jgi:predicted Zn-dependent protease